MPFKQPKRILTRSQTVCQERSASPSMTFSRVSSKARKKHFRHTRHHSDIDEQSFMSKRRQRFKTQGPPKCAQQFYLSPLTHRSNYSSYGACSDKTVGQVNASFPRPDPYRGLQLEVMAILQKKNLTQPATSTPSCKLDLGDECDLFLSCSEGSGAWPDSPGTCKGDYQYDTEDDEEEDGVPQAVRASLTHQEPTTSVEITKALHLQKMERIARSVHPENLLAQLDSLGYLKHQYTQHSRSSLDQQNLKSGLKKDGGYNSHKITETVNVYANPNHLRKIKQNREHTC